MAIPRMTGGRLSSRFVMRGNGLDKGQPVGRDRIVETSGKAAVKDIAFRELIAVGDRFRDDKAWRDAENAYRDALELYPYQPSYWVQVGHMQKEQERFVDAEVSYRTACAFGVAPEQVLAHLRFVLAREGISEKAFPIRFQREAASAKQVPGRPDVQCLARLLWHVDDLGPHEMADLLRGSETCDELFATMVKNPRFERANVSWLSVYKEGDL